MTKLRDLYSGKRSPRRQTEGSMYYIYVLKSLKNGRLYTGSTNNIERRLEEHNNRRSKYTGYTGPYEIIYKEEFETNIEARRRELYLKTGKGREALKKLIDDVAGFV